MLQKCLPPPTLSLLKKEEKPLKSQVSKRQPALCRRKTENKDISPIQTSIQQLLLGATHCLRH